MIRARWIVGAIALAAAAGSWLLMPPAARKVPPSPGLRPPVRGAIHIHTRRSDGTGTVDDVARAASAAGLNFVIVTDHGDGTREPDAPAYRHGVLCIDAVEISTTGGHVVALGLPRTTYSLGGQTRDVVEDIERLGGMAIAAHPGSARSQLQWNDWNLPINGIEWMNADSEWRDEGVLAFARTLLTYPFRRPETLAALLDRPADVLERWDQLTAQRPMVAVAGADAHARIPLTSVGDPYDNRISLPVPGYEQIFRTFSIALPGVTLTGEPAADANTVVEAIRRGRVFSSIDALAGLVSLSFTATGASGVTTSMGEDTVVSGSLQFEVGSNAPESVSIALLRNGQAVHTGAGPRLEYSSSEPGVYRVEMQWPGAPGDPPIPWVVSNPIYALASPRPARTSSTPVVPTQLTVRYGDGPATDWHIEHSPRSQGALDVVPTIGGTQLLMRYALGGTEDEGPYVAASMSVPQGLADYQRLIFTGQSNRATRIWVQLRVPGEGQGRSWHRSVYLDDTPRTISVAFDELTPLEPTTTGTPILADVRDVLFVVDTMNTRPGTSGQIWIDEVKVGR